MYRTKFSHDITFFVTTIQHQALLTCNNNTPDLLYSVLCLTHLKVSGKPHGPRSYGLQTSITLEYLWTKRQLYILTCFVPHTTICNLFSICAQGYDIALIYAQVYPSTWISLFFPMCSYILKHIWKLVCQSCFASQSNTKRKLIQTICVQIWL